MAISASKVKATGGNGGFKIEPLEAGNYPARLVSVIDLGLQPQRPYQGQEKPPKHEIQLTYELVTEFMKDDAGNDLEDKPRHLSERVPLNHISQDLAKSTKRAKAIDPKQEHAGDFEAMLGMACTVTVSQSPSKQDPTKIYNNVMNVTPPMKGFPVPELKNDTKAFDLDSPDLNLFLSLPEFIQNIIKDNLEFQGSELQKLLGGAAPEPTPEPEEEDAPFDDDVPY